MDMTGKAPHRDQWRKLIPRSIFKRWKQISSCLPFCLCFSTMRALTAGTSTPMLVKAGTWCFLTPQTGRVKTTINSHPAASNTLAISWSWRKMTASRVRKKYQCPASCLHCALVAAAFRLYLYLCICSCVYLLVCSFWAVSDQPICGNQIIEEGEECDVGNKDTDLCCYSAKEPVGIQCHLKPGKICRYSTWKCAKMISKTVISCSGLSEYL